MPDGIDTRASLLARMKNGGLDEDWADFYRQYSPLIVRFCMKRGLDEAGARDVLQETMMLVLRKLPDFEYNRRVGLFRNWLLTLVHGKVRDWRKRLATARRHLVDAGDSRLLADALENPEPGVDAQAAAAWERSLLEEALHRIQADPRTQDKTFEIFRAHALEGESPEDVAKRFQVDRNAVYQIKNRWIKRLQREIELLESGRTKNSDNDPGIQH